MAGLTQTRVVGLDDLKRKFAGLPVDISKKALRKGASAGARVIKGAVIAGTPIAPRQHRKGVAPGLLRRSALIKYVREKSGPDQATFIVTYRQGKKAQQTKRGKLTVNLDAFYAKYVERGHRIVPRSRRIGTYRGKGLYATSKASRRRAAGGTVPGRFFFATAIRAASPKALSATVDTMSAVIDKLVK